MFPRRPKSVTPPRSNSRASDRSSDGNIGAGEASDEQLADSAAKRLRRHDLSL